MISFAFCVLLVRGLKEPPALCAGEPVPEPSTEFSSTPFTRLMLAARSGLSKPLSEAS